MTTDGSHYLNPRSWSHHSLRVGLLGGTFDPVHNGHVEVAQTALRMARLDAVYFVTSVDPPHKSKKTRANFLDRHAMVALALACKPQLIPSSIEFERPGKSYSVDTVRQLKESLGNSTKIFFLIGIDAFQDITSWKEYSALPELCSFLIFARPGFATKDLVGKLPKVFLRRMFSVSRESEFLETQENGFYLLEEFSNRISSTEIRNQVQLGRSISEWVPESVAEYIYKTKLYLAESKI